MGQDVFQKVPTDSGHRFFPSPNGAVPLRVSAVAVGPSSPLGPRNPSTGGHFPFQTFIEPCTVRMSSHTPFGHHRERPFPGRCRGRAVPVGRREENGQPKSTSLHR